MKEFKKLSPKKKFGQNFIEDQVLLNELVDLIEIEKKDIFVEIGPGTGNLTELIINRSTSCTSVEIDRNLVPLLEKRFKNIKGFKLINRDILSFNINTISEGEKSIRIAGNLPYNLSSPILEWSIKNINTIIDMHFMLQKEFAERCAGNENSKSYGKLSVICDYLFEVSILKDVDKSFFIPPPKVDSAFVRFKPKRKTLNEIEFVNLKKILNPLFNAKRKKVKKTLLSLFSEKDLESTGINLNLRPDELDTESFIKLSKLIKNNG